MNTVWRCSSLLQARQSRAASTASCSALQSKQRQNSQQPQRSSSGKLASRPQWSGAGRHRAEHQQQLQVAGLLCRTRAVKMAVRMPEVNSRMVRKTVVPSAVAHRTVHSVACGTSGITHQVNVLHWQVLRLTSKTSGIAHQVNVLHWQVLRLTSGRSHTGPTHHTHHDPCSRPFTLRTERSQSSL